MQPTHTGTDVNQSHGPVGSAAQHPVHGGQLLRAAIVRQLQRELTRVLKQGLGKINGDLVAHVQPL